MSTARISRNEPCPCGSGRKFKHCCNAASFGAAVPQPRPVSTDGAFLRRGPELPRRPSPQLKPITRVAVEYCIADTMGKAEISFCYPLGTQIILADGNVLPVDWLRPGMQFRLEDGGVATTTKVEEPKVWEPPSKERDANGNSLRRVVGTVKYTGYFARMDFGVPGDVIKTTPGHLFFSLNRRGWHPIETFERGECFRNEQGIPVPVEWIGPQRWEFCDLYNIEVEEYHTYFVGGGPSGSIWTHNGMDMGCRVPRAAVAEENGMRVVTPRQAGIVRPDRHHIFPQEFRDFFRARGVKIDRYTLQLDNIQGMHGALHFGGGPGLGGGWWNNKIMGQLFAAEAALPAGQQLSARQILRIGAQVRREAGLAQFKIINYFAP